MLWMKNVEVPTMDQLTRLNELKLDTQLLAVCNGSIDKRVLQCTMASYREHTERDLDKSVWTADFRQSCRKTEHLDGDNQKHKKIQKWKINNVSIFK